MNSIKSNPIAGRFLGLFFSLVLAGSAYAGPAPQFWHSVGKSAAQPVAPAIVAPAMACPTCQTTAVTQFSAINISGKAAPHYATVGVQHACAMCGGAIATIYGKTTNTMKAGCPICAKANLACCSTSS